MSRDRTETTDLTNQHRTLRRWRNCARHRTALAARTNVLPWAEVQQRMLENRRKATGLTRIVGAGNQL